MDNIQNFGIHERIALYTFLVIERSGNDLCGGGARAGGGADCWGDGICRVADGVDAMYICFAVVVDEDVALWIEGDFIFYKFGVWLDSYSSQKDSGRQVFGFSGCYVRYFY